MARRKKKVKAVIAEPKEVTEEAWIAEDTQVEPEPVVEPEKKEDPILEGLIATREAMKELMDLLKKRYDKSPSEELFTVLAPASKSYREAHRAIKALRMMDS